MNKFNLFSKSLNKDMTVNVYGEGKKPYIVFPTSEGNAGDFENFSMISSINEQHGFKRITLYCIESHDSKTFYNTDDPKVRISRHADYENYVFEELIPFIKKKHKNNFIGFIGCSFGGYHAINFGLKHPDIVKEMISLIGIFDIQIFFDSYYDENIYFNCPLNYLRNLNDTHIIRQMKEQKIYLGTGTNDFCLDENKRLSQNLTYLGIPHLLDIWEGADHHWYWWKMQVNKFLR